MMRPNATGWILVAFFFIGGIAFTVTMPGIYIGQIWIGVSVLLAIVYFVMSNRAGSADKLKQTGIPGQAHILEITQTGTYINEQPRVRFRFRVEGSGLDPYEVKKTITVPQIALGALTAGRPLTVYIDPANHEKFAIDWFAQPAAAAAPAQPAPHVEGLT